MTTVVAAYCPWFSGVPAAQAITFVADSQLSTPLASGDYAAIPHLRGQKLFKLSDSVMAAYSGSSRSAKFAIRCLATSIPKASRLPASPMTEPFVRLSLERGARRAEFIGMHQPTKAGCGAFVVFVAFLDAVGNLKLVTHCRPNDSTNRYGVVNSPLVAGGRMFIMGSGMDASLEFLKSLTLVRRQVEPETALEDMPFKRQAGILGLALIDVLEQGKAPYSGMGLQAMSLTREGVEGWTIASSSLEYIDRPKADPTWKLHGPRKFNA